MLNIAICDDEKNICSYIEKRTVECLAKADEEADIKVFYDGSDLLANCKDNPTGFDIIFLDIKMKTINGVECAKLLRETGVESLIVFVTSSAEYVFTGYEVKAFRYILKTDLVNAFDRIFGECLEELRKKVVDFFKSSPEVGKICTLQLFTWIGIMSLNIFFTQYAIHTVFGVPDLTSATEEVKNSFNYH